MPQRIISIVVAFCILFAAAPARAEHDPILGPENSGAATTKKVVVLGL